MNGSAYPNDWLQIPIGRIGKVVTGNTPPKVDEQNYGLDVPWVSPIDIGSGKYVTSTRNSLSLKGAKLARVVPAGSILVTCIASIGKNAIAAKALCTNQQINAIIVDEGINNEYVYYCIEHHGVPLLQKYAGRTAVPIVSKGLFEQLVLPFPQRKKEQQKISDILTTVDDKQDVIVRQIDAFQSLKQGLMQILLSRGVGTQGADGRWVPHSEFKDSELGQIPAGWDVKEVGAIATVNPARTKVRNEAQNVTFLGMVDVSEDGKIIKRHIKKYADVAKGFTSFSDNDVLVAKITPCFENGKGALVFGLENGVGFGSTEFHVIRTDANVLDARFLHAHTRTKNFRLLGEQNMVGSAGQKRVPAEFMRSHLIAIPPLSEQQKITEILGMLDSKVEALVIKQAHFQTLKRGLMQKLLTGEWRVKLDEDQETAIAA